MNFIKKFFSQPKSPEQVAEHIMWLVAKESFDKFREKNFRTQLAFDHLDEEEQNRIFNELVVTGLALAYLSMETVEKLNSHEQSKLLFRSIKNNLCSAYVKQLRSGDVEKELCDLWYALLAKRCQEYREDYKNYKENFSNRRENQWVGITAIGGLHHIRRGKSTSQDALLPDFSRWCGRMNINIQKAIAYNSQN